MTNDQLRAGLASKLRPGAPYTEQDLTAFALGVEWAGNIQRDLADFAAKAGFLNANHLAKISDELDELFDFPEDPMEMADVLLALMLHAEQNGIDLISAARTKLAAVKTRTYGAPDNRGVVRHVAPN